MQWRRSLDRSLVVLLACATALPHCAPARQRTPAGDWERVRNLPSGTLIVVKTKGGAAYHGELIGAAADSVRLDSDERSFPGRVTTRRELRREDVLEVRRFSKRGSALAGAGIGAATGAGIGIAIDASARSNEDRGVVTVVLLFLGGLLGWAVGRHSTIVKGEIIYAAP